jgi:hypothetical protein
MPWYVERFWISSCADCDQYFVMGASRICKHPDVAVHPRAPEGIMPVVSPASVEKWDLAKWCLERYGEAGVPPWCPFLAEPTMLGAPERSVMTTVEDLGWTNLCQPSTENWLTTSFSCGKST